MKRLASSLLLSFAIAGLASAQPGVYFPTAPTGAPVPVNTASVVAFPSTPVATAATAQPVTFTLGAAVTLAATPYVVLTRGAANLDFQAAGTQAGNACVAAHLYAIGDTCTVSVVFNPTVPGLRLGAVQLMSAGGTVATAAISGTATGPQISYPIPTAQTSLGSGFSGFSASGGGPHGVAVDGAGDVFVAVEATSAVYEIVATNGTVSANSSIVQVGSGFSGPYTVAVDGAGDVFVSDENTRQVYEIVATNGVVSATSSVVIVGSGFTVPTGLVVDGAGDVFVADYGAQGVYEIVASKGVVSATSPVKLIASIGNYPVGIALDAAGDIFVGNQAGAVYQIAASAGVVSPSSPVTQIGTFGNARGLAVDAAGDVYVSDDSYRAVKEIIATNGTVSTSSTVVNLGGGYKFPRTLTLSDRGDIFVSDEGNGVVYKLDFSDAPSLKFATTAAGATSSDSPQTVTVANIGNAPLNFTKPNSGSNPSTSANFSLNSSSFGTCLLVQPGSYSAVFLSEGSRCTLPISFTPGTGGAITGTETLTDNNLNATNAGQVIALSGTGAATGLSISPATQTFPTTSVGVKSAVLTSTLTNNGPAAAYLSSGSLTDSKDFAATNNCNGLLAVNATCVVSFTFTPQSAAGLSSTFSIADLNAPNSPATVTLNGTGTAALTVPTLTPSTLAFGAFPVGFTSTTLSTTLPTNPGGALIISAVTITGTNASSFAFGQYCVILGPSCNGIPVTCTPTVVGPLTATLVVSFTASPQQTVALTCAGTAPQATLSPSSLTFTATTGTATTPQTVTLSNPGTGVLTITSVAVTGTNASAFLPSNSCGTSLAAGASCALTVSFNAVTAGSFNAALTVIDTVGTQTVALTGTATASASTLPYLYPATLDFGTAVIGNAAAAKTLTFSNPAQTALPVSSILLSGANGTEFSIAKSTCGASVPALSSCALTIAYKPTIPGVVSATVTVTDQAGTQAAPITGTGAAPSDFVLSGPAFCGLDEYTGQGSCPLTVSAADPAHPFVGTVTLSAASKDLNSGTSYTFTPPYVVPGATAVSVTLDIQDAGVNARSAPAHRIRPTGTTSGTLTFAFCGCMGFLMWRRKRLPHKPLSLLVALVWLPLLLLAGCEPVAFTGTVVVTATDGNITHVLNITVKN